MFKNFVPTPLSRSSSAASSPSSSPPPSSASLSLVIAMSQQDHGDLEKAGQSKPDVEAPGVARVAYVDGLEDRHGISTRPRGVDMERTMTKEDKELAAAGYDHLDSVKKGKAADDKSADVDIIEHHYTYQELAANLETSIDTKDAAQSHGLTAKEAKDRLTRHGPNILSPPKKKSAFRKVRPGTIPAISPFWAHGSVFSTWTVSSPCSTFS